MSFTTDAVAAQQVQIRLKSLFSLVHEIEKKRKQSEVDVNNITKCQSVVTQDEKNAPQHQAKLRSLYKAAISHAEQEEELLRDALQKIAEIRNIKNERRIQARLAGNNETIHRAACMKMLHTSAQTLPLFIGKIGEKPPPLCGAIPADPSYYAKVGDMVVTLVEVAGDGKNWILAEVVSFNPATNKYEVDDILEEVNQKKRHTLTKKHVVPLPLMRANPETDPEALFPLGVCVMALYPRTTCFYNAIVHKLPETHVDNYELLFEDQNYPEGYSPPLPVAQRYVIALQQQQSSKFS